MAAVKARRRHALGELASLQRSRMSARIAALGYRISLCSSCVTGAAAILKLAGPCISRLRIRSSHRRFAGTWSAWRSLV